MDELDGKDEIQPNFSSVASVEQIAGSNDAYRESSAIQKIRSSLAQKRRPCIAFFDIDSTVDSGGKSWKAVNEIRDQMDNNGIITCFNTSRTEEMVVSKQARNVSPQFTRSEPRLGTIYHYDRPPINGNAQTSRVLAKPEHMVPRGILDADVISGSTGTEIYLQESNNKGYVPDATYNETQQRSEMQWNQAATDLIKRIIATQPPEIRGTFGAVESQTVLNPADVDLPDHRVAISFKTLQGKQDFESRLGKLKKSATNRTSEQPDTRLDALNGLLSFLADGFTARDVETAQAVGVFDESNPNKGQFATLLIPQERGKKNATDRVAKQLADAAGIPLSEFDVLLGGDAWPDVEMGLFSCVGAKVTFLLASKSRLANNFRGVSTDFAGIDTTTVSKLLTPIAGKPGYYIFDASGRYRRTVIVADEAFSGTSPTESVKSFLNSIDNTKKVV